MRVSAGWSPTRSTAIWLQAPKIAKEVGFTHVIAGVYWYNEAQLAREKQAALAQWPYYDVLIVGNEGLQGGVCQAGNGRECYTRARLAEEVAYFRTHTNQPVTTTETGWQYLADTTLLDVGDFAMPNLQSWFNSANHPNDPAAMAQAVADEYAALLAARPERLVVIKETWWPTAGHAAASEANQSLFFQGLVARSVKFVWGEAYDAPWKSGEISPFGSFGPNWGLYRSDGSPKAAATALRENYSDSYYPVEVILTGAANVLRRLHRGAVTGGLPLNEATAAELNQLGNGTLVTTQSHWVPAQLGYWFTAAVGARIPPGTAGFCRGLQRCRI